MMAKRRIISTGRWILTVHAHYDPNKDKVCPFIVVRAALKTIKIIEHVAILDHRPEIYMLEIPDWFDLKI